MAGPRVVIDIEGERQLSRKFEIMADGIEDFSKPLREINQEYRSAIDRNFASRGAEFGESWAPRKASYPWPLLQRSGKMRNSMYSTISKVELKIENMTDYFKYHQSRAPRTKLPRRVMFALDERRAQMVMENLQKYIVGIVRRGKPL